MQRREFLAALAATPLLGACGRTSPSLPDGALTGAHQALGHRLRQPDFPPPSETRRVTVAIVGGGIGGLSAGWKLMRSGCDDLLLLELEATPGGNSRAGENSISAYPLGAHYLPLPPPEARATRELLRELGALRGEHDYDERLLCQAPQERLYIDGWWQEGLWPTHRVAKAERTDTAAFQDYLAELRQRRDAAGRRPFALPMSLSSREKSWRELDRLPFADWLRQQGYSAPGLFWRADHACRDDYGASAAQTSAWAGLHYFACRDEDEGQGSTAHRLHGQVLTTPGGNAWLAAGLAAPLGARIQSAALVWRVEETPREVLIDVYLAAENRSLRIIARELIWAAPLFLIPHVFVAVPARWRAALAGLDYAPWAVVNLSLSEPPHTRAGAGLAWDNALHDSHALGYVVATHQAMRYAPGPTVISWYRALHEESADQQELSRPASADFLQSREAWAEEALADLSRPHPEIRELATRIDVHLHGHAMIRPRPGWLWDGRREVFEQGSRRVRFAHADVSGFSLFEEANHRGVLAAERTLARLGVSFSSSCC